MNMREIINIVTLPDVETDQSTPSKNKVLTENGKPFSYLNQKSSVIR
jgi:hypothetical protein